MVRYFFIFLVALPLFTKGQSWDFSVPEKLSNNVNTDYEEALPLLSPDGKVLYFSRVLYPENIGGKWTGSDVWESQYDAATHSWSKAKNAKEVLNNKGNNAVVGVSGNGKTIYLLNAASDGKAEGIYFSKKISKGWTKPELIRIEGIESRGFFSIYVSPDFDVLFLSMKAPDSKGEEDLYVSFKNSSGVWSSPKNLGASINTTGFEISPFLSADKKRLYFSSNGHAGFGEADIFYCDRLYNAWDTWSAPRNLGEKLNSNKFDAYFSIYGDSTAYFTSNRSGKYSDIYHVKVTPGNEVLAFGQRYLSNEEINKVIGASVSRKVTFEKSNTQVTAIQKELLFYIANKLSQDKEVNVQLAVIEDNNEPITEARLASIVDQLKMAGLEASRIITDNNPRNKKENKSRTVVDILFFK